MGKSLKEKDIPSVSYYSVPLHLQPVFKHLGYQTGDFSATERVVNDCISLPVGPYLNQEEQAKVIGAISKIIIY
jgi:UDP-2-acetamido-2-deoxy-ribo-hexuluronate aminotransferase